MDLNWLQSIIYGLFAGLTDILPVSAQAHKVLILKLFGIRTTSAVLELLIHFGVFAALYYHCQANLIRMNRARALARIPKKKRKRPLDVRSLMDWRLLITMIVPVTLGIILYQFVAKIQKSFVFISIFLFLNGIILYVPQYLPSGNRDSRTLSRVEGILMGLGGAFSILPGMSAMGVAASIGSVCGVERKFSLNMVLMMNLAVVFGLGVYDVLTIVENGIGSLSLLILVQYILSAASSFLGTSLGIRIMQRFAEDQGYGMFGIYCWGMALFTFILNLMA